MTNPRIKRILNDLGRYYGIRQNISSVSIETDNTSRSNAGGSLIESDSFIENIVSKSNSTPSTQAILRRSRELPVSGASHPIVMTPFFNQNTDIDDYYGTFLVNDGYQGQGNLASRQISQIYTTNDYIDFKNEEGVFNRVTVMQNFSPSTTASNVDTDFVSLFMNSITTLEMSRAVPYLQVAIASAVKDEAESDEDSMTPMTIGRFLLGPNASPSEANFMNSEPVVVPLYDSTEGLSEKKLKMKMLAGMEAFTSPQTMVNAGLAFDESGSLYSNQSLDPFQPFMSLQSLKLTVQGQGGLMSYKSGNIELILHDKSRLNEITPLIAPSRFGTTRLTITYGYSHPDGNLLSRGAINDQERNLIGELVDSMRVTESYMVTNSSFNFDQKAVKISLKISLLGSKTLNEVDVTSTSKKSETEADIIKLIKDLQTMIAKINNDNQKNKITEITIPSFIQSYDTLTTAGIPKSVLDELKKFRASIKKSGNADLNSLVDKVIGSNSNKIEGVFSSMIDSKKEILKNIMQHLATTPDPFLIPLKEQQHQIKFEVDQFRESISGNPEYISFGKIISYFVGKSLSNYYSSINEKNFEIQFIFHPFNQDAAGIQDYNIAQFPIVFSDFKTIIEKHYTVFGNMSIAKFMTLMVDYFINDMGAAAYGFLSSKEREKYARDPEDLAKRVSKQEKQGKADSGKEQSYAEIVANKRSERLRIIYGNPEDTFPVEFRKPEIVYEIQTTPMREEWEERDDSANKNNGVVVKFHIMDRVQSTSHTLASTLNSAGTNRLVPKLKRFNRSADFPVGANWFNNHEKYASKPLEILENFGYLKEITPEFLSQLKASSPQNPSEGTQVLDADMSLLEKVAVHYYLFETPEEVDSNNSIREIISSIYPALRYGTAASGLLRLSVGSMNDASLTNIMLVRNGNEAYGSEAQENRGVPLAVMPVELSAETLGCPFFSYAQFYYLDLKTNTNIDNVYSVTNIDHSIQPGKFSTSIKLIQVDSYGVFRPLDDEMKRVALNAALYQLGYRKPESNSSKQGKKRKKSGNEYPADFVGPIPPGAKKEDTQYPADFVGPIPPGGTRQ